MKNGKGICINFLVLVFSLLCLFSLECISMGMADSVRLNLIKEEQLNMKPGSGNDLYFLGKPVYIGASKGNFAPVVYIDQDAKQDVIRVEGENIKLPWSPRNENIIISRILYSHKDNIIGYIISEFNSDMVEPETEFEPIRRFVSQTMDGRILWHIEYPYLGDAQISGIGTIFIIRQDTINGGFGSSGVYVYDLQNGHLLGSFEDPKISIWEYAFSGDGNKLVFEYIVDNPNRTEEDILNPRSHLACIDAKGYFLWDIEVKPVYRISVSYDGNRVIYTSDPTYDLLQEKLGKKLYRKVGLIDEKGYILWELDNPSDAEVDILPSGSYYYTVLYADQPNIWDITTKKEPVYYCLFESLTHKNIWRNELETLVPQLKEGWYTIGAGTISLDNQWRVFVFSNYQSGHLMQGGSGPIRNLLVLKNFLTNEIVYQQEFDKEVYKVLTSPDSKIIELLFWDGRRMLFERIP